MHDAGNKSTTAITGFGREAHTTKWTLERVQKLHINFCRDCGNKLLQTELVICQHCLEAAIKDIDEGFDS